MKLVVNSRVPFALPQIACVLCIDKHQCMSLNKQKLPSVAEAVFTSLDISLTQYCRDRSVLLISNGG